MRARKRRGPEARVPNGVSHEVLTVRGTWLYARLVKPAERSVGGIFLPEVSQKNLTHAIVVSAGPGLARIPQESFLPGTHVIFSKHAFLPLSKDEIQVRQEDVIASAWEEDGILTLLPENDWVMIDRTAAEERSRGGVILPEGSRRRARSGRLVDVGEGLLRLEGDRRGTRRECKDIMNWQEDRSAVVYWGPAAECPEVNLAGQTYWFVRAGDLIAAEVDDEG